MERDRRLAWDEESDGITFRDGFEVVTRRIWDPDGAHEIQISSADDELERDFDKFKETPFGKCYLEKEAKCFDKGGSLRECGEKAALKCMQKEDP